MLEGLDEVLLIELVVYNVLEQPPLPQPILEYLDEIKDAHKLRQKDDVHYKRHIINYLLDCLCDL